MKSSAENRRNWVSAARFWVNNHKIEGDVDRKEAILRFRRDVERSSILLAQLLDITGETLVQHCRTCEDRQRHPRSLGFARHGFSASKMWL